MNNVRPCTSDLQQSPMQYAEFQGQGFYIKRDDLMSPDLGGNKGRKFRFLLKQPSSQLEKLVAFGSAQANSLLSLAVLCHRQGWQLDYYVQRLLPIITTGSLPSNYQRAKALGVDIKTWPADISAEQVEPYLQGLTVADDSCLFVSEGGRIAEAESGIAELAEELNLWAKQQGIIDWAVVLPSGTGTTAVFLQRHLHAPVYTCACVGGEAYLRRQFFSLVADATSHPHIIASEQKFHFGKLKLSSYQMWLALKAQTNIEFDLLYDPMAWQVVVPWLRQHRPSTTLVYLHQGGVGGNVTMLPRYQRKYPSEGE